MRLHNALAAAQPDVTGCRWVFARRAGKLLLACQWPDGKLLAEVRRQGEHWRAATRLPAPGPGRWYPVPGADPCRL